MLIDKVKVCEPVDSFIQGLLNVEFTIVEKYLSDYHFLYIKLKGDLSKITDINHKGLTLINGKYICDCHWSRAEVIMS